MKYSLTTVVAATLYLSAATALPTFTASPRADDTVQVQVKNGDGDASVQLTITLNSLQTKQASGAGFGAAVNAFVVDPGTTCEFFADAAGTTPLGGQGPFGQDEVSFTSASNGGVDSNPNDALKIGSACCAADADFQNACGQGDANVNTVRIQISTIDDQATQGEIPADGQAHVLPSPLDGDRAFEAFIVDAENAHKPTCQAFTDKKGTKALGKPFSTRARKFNGKDIKAVACQEN